MKLFEDIIDSVSDVQDDTQTSEIVSGNDIVYVVNDDIDEFRGDTSLMHKLTVTTSRKSDEEIARQASILDSIMEASPVIADYSLINVWTDRTHGWFCRLVVRFDFIEDPDYANVLRFLIAINNLFYNTDANHNHLQINSGVDDDHAYAILGFSMQFKGSSLHTILNSIRNGISTYRTMYPNDTEYNLSKISRYSDLIRKIVSMIYNDTFVPERDNALLQAIEDLDVSTIRY
jgi:hypothetical protein